MKIIYKIYFIAFSFFLASSLVYALPSRAEQAGIQISPLTYNFEINPEGDDNFSIIVKNLNNDDLHYVIEIENFNHVSDQGAPSFEGTSKDTSITSLKDWIVATKDSDKEGSIEPNGTKEVEFTISVPKGAEPGGHYAAVFVKELAKTDQGRTQIGVSSRVGTLVLVSIPGDVKRTAEISEFEVPKIIWSGPADLSMKVKNTGTVHFDSRGVVEAKTMFGHITEVDMGTHTIIPQNTRFYEGNWASRYPFGRYTLTAKATDGDGNTVSESRILWALPLIIVIPIIVGLIALIWVVFYLKKHIRIVK